MNRIAEAMFGRLEPADPGTVLERVRQRAKDVLQKQRALVQNQLDGLAGSEVAMLQGVRTALLGSASNIERTLCDLPRTDEPSRVVLLGRTQAGKSTLFRYLTGSEQSDIGSGGQRTTTEVIRAPYRLADGITVADTPGVGAKDGDDDLRLALEEARRADLIIWVATTNSLQEQTRFALDLVASWGTPLILVVNCLEDISSSAARRMFLKYPALQPAQVLAAEPGHVSRAARTLGDHGQAALRVVPVHAQAAQLSLVVDEDAASLVEASGIDRLVRTILDELAGSAAFRRATATSDAARLTCVEVAAHADGLAAELGEWAVVSESAIADLAHRAERLIDDAGPKYAAAVRKRLRWLNDWADQHYGDNEKELEAHWIKTTSVLDKDLQAVFDSNIVDLKAELEQLSTDVWSSWERTVRRATTSQGPKLTGRVNPTWLAPAAQAAANLLGVAVGHLLRSYPPTIFLAPVAPVLLAEVASKMFGGRESQLKRRRASLTSHILKERIDRQGAAEMDWRRFSSERTERLSCAESTLQEDLSAVAASREQLVGLAQVAAGAVRQLDRDLCEDVLRMEGRLALADGVKVVNRQPGAVVALGLRNEAALLETYLRPPQHLGDARWYSDSPDTSAGRKVAHTLALGRTNSQMVCHATGYSVQIGQGMSAAKIAAESRVASDVACCAVGITILTEGMQ